MITINEIIDKVNNFTLNPSPQAKALSVAKWLRVNSVKGLTSCRASVRGKIVLGEILRGVYPEANEILRFAPAFWRGSPIRAAG